MLCILNKPSKLDQTKFPGAKSRYDDFVVVHMNQTMSIHNTVGLPTTPALLTYAMFLGIWLINFFPPISTGKLPFMASLLHLVL